MKNKKILFISAFLILAFAGGIFFATGKVEEKWEVKEKGTNTLSSNSENITTGETTFDYPYTNLTPEMCGAVDTPIRWVEDENGTDGSISFQQGANFAGELLKDIYGYTDTQKEPVGIIMYYTPDYLLDGYADIPLENMHLEMHFTNCLSEPQNNIIYNGRIDPVSGKVTFLHWKNYEILEQQQEQKDYLPYRFTQEEAIRIYDTEIKTIMALMGYTSPATEIKYTNLQNADWIESYKDTHRFWIKCEDGSRHTLKFLKDNGELVRYRNWDMVFPMAEVFPFSFGKFIILNGMQVSTEKDDL